MGVPGTAGDYVGGTKNNFQEAYSGIIIPLYQFYHFPSCFAVALNISLGGL